MSAAEPTDRGPDEAGAGTEEGASHERLGESSDDAGIVEAEAEEAAARDDDAVTTELAEDGEDGSAGDSTTEDDPGETLFYEPGGSWALVVIGGGLIAAVAIMEILGPGRVHWPVLSIFFVIFVGFGWLQKAAAQRHVSVHLTETTLRQGAQTVKLADIAEVYPENRGREHAKWESALALGELPAVPRRRKGVGVRMKDGKLAQAWARDVDRFRSELTEAHLAVKMGLTPRKHSGDGADS
ncbi:DUF3093 domain-containing protein [Gordonia iterans]